MRIFVLFFLFVSVGFAQNNITGLVVNQDGKPVQDALVQAPELALQTQSDENGSFVLDISSSALLTVSADSYQTYVAEVSPGDVITINLLYEEVDGLDQFSESMSMITLSDDELSEDDQAADNISGLLQSSRDVFLRTAAYELSSSFFRVRGLDSDLGSVRMNGIPMNKFYNGRPQWSNWGGLNDLMRNQEFNAGLQTSDYGFGGLIGSTNINTKASSYRSGGRVTYSSSNRSYANRVLVSYASGLNTKGWAYALAVSNRWGESGFNDGTFYDAQSVMLSVEKVLENQSLNLTFIATPNRRGKSSPNTQEVYDLMGTKYNEYWGNQNGEQRNSRVKRLDEPIIMMNHEIQLSSTSTLQSSVAYQFGELGNSRFDYPGGANPSPTYYQKLPSYFLADADGPDYAGAFLAQERLLSDGQIDWSRIYDANLTAAASDLPAAYVLYEDRSDDTQLTLNTSLKSFLSDRVSVVFALTHQDLQSENFAEIQDMMGASRYLNRDSFDGYAYNLEDPDGIAGVGDRFKYNYIFDVQQTEAFLKTQFSLNRFDGFAAGSL